MLSDQIRQALRDTNESRYAIARATGVSQSQLSRFLGGRWLAEATLDRLAEHLDLVVMPRSEKRQNER